MNGEILVRNVFYLFIIAIILESCIMAIFSMSIFKRIDSTQPVQTARDVIVLALAVLLCYKVDAFLIFRETEIKVPYMLNVGISALVMTRMTNLIRDFFSRIRNAD